MSSLAVDIASFRFDGDVIYSPFDCVVMGQMLVPPQNDCISSTRMFFTEMKHPRLMAEVGGLRRLVIVTFPITAGSNSLMETTMQRSTTTGQASQLITLLITRGGKLHSWGRLGGRVYSEFPITEALAGMRGSH